MNKFIIPLVFLTVLFSCRKVESEELAVSKVINQNTSSISSNYSRENTDEEFLDIFKSIDGDRLRQAIENEDSDDVQYILNNLNEQILEKYSSIYGVNLGEEFHEDPDKITVLGLLLAGRAAGMSEDPMNCFLTAVGTFLGITQAQQIWNSILAGAAEDTVIATLKMIGRRVGSIISVGIMIYSVGQCLDWW